MVQNLISLETLTMAQVLQAGRIIVKNKKLDLYEISSREYLPGKWTFSARNCQTTGMYTNAPFDVIYNYCEDL